MAGAECGQGQERLVTAFAVQQRGYVAEYRFLLLATDRSDRVRAH